MSFSKKVATLILPSLLCFVFLSPPPICEGACNDKVVDSTRSTKRIFFKDVLLDQAAIWSSPARIRPNDLTWFLPLAGTTAVLISRDSRINDMIADTPERHKVSRQISVLGSSSVTLGTAGGLFCIGKIAKNDHIAETGMLGVEALIGSSVFVQVLKAATRRERPSVHDSQGRFWVGGHSFPSGHAASSWAIAAVIAGQFPHKHLLQAGFFAVASAVGIARVTGKDHFPSDVLVGSSAGYLIGNYLVARHKSLHSDHPLPALLPYTNGKGEYGVEFYLRW